MNAGDLTSGIIKKVLGIVVITIFLLPYSYANETLRCGNDLIQVGDSAYLVESKVNECGEVFSKTDITKKVWHSFPNSYFEVIVTGEAWFVLVNGYCYDLKFEGNKLTEIGGFIRCE